MVEYSLYIHVPFCRHKCGYCPFYVIPNKEKHITLYFSALKKEWEMAAPFLQGRRLVSIYFGGGTPSLLSPQQIQDILSWISPPPLCEITLEANPESLSSACLQGFKEAGINRLSLGAQSFDPHLLPLLERSHTPEAVAHAVQNAKEMGIDNISLDLMYDIPQQTFLSWQNSLDAALSLPITHLSLYNLTFEPHTGFYKRRAQLLPQVPLPEISLEMLSYAVEHLRQKGWERYEISAFSLPGYSSQHNTGYWTNRPFWGLGPSAWSYWEGKRIRNTAHLHRYARALSLGNAPIDFTECLPLEQHVCERLAIGLRRLEGIAEAEWPSWLASTYSSLEEALFLKKSEGRIALTDKGLLFHDTVATTLMEACS